MKKQNEKFIGKIIEMLDKVDENTWENYLISTAVPNNPFTQNTYKGFNSLICYIDILLNSRKSVIYSTFKAIKDNGGKVKKGAKSIPIIYLELIYTDENNNRITEKEAKELEKNEKKINVRKFVRSYNVFNLEDTENLDLSQFEEKNETIKNIENADNFIKNIEGLKINYSEYTDDASYNIVTDIVSIPNKKFFKDENHYYSTVFHEITHWTGHKNRLDRKLSVSNQNAYAFEELVAELGSMLLCENFNVNTYINSIKYLKNWLNFTENNKEENLNKAFMESKKAVNYIFSNSANKI